MAIYTTDEITFEVPDGFADRSVTVLASKDVNHPMSLVINRDALEGPVEKHVAEAVEGIKKIAPATKILGQRDREVGSLPAREIRFSTATAKRPIYVRQAYVPYYDTLLSFSFSAGRTQQPRCDALADRLLEGARFRRRA